MPKRSPAGSEFHAEASAPRVGFFRELWAFFKHQKKWWLLPIVVAIVILGLLVSLGGSSLAPFIYTVF